MRKMSWLLTFVLCGAVAGWCVRAPAQEVGGVGVKENLDLPLDALGETEEDEDAPESILFYGQTFEGDGFFFTVDHSGSMNDSGELAVAKREIIRNIQELSDRSQFAVNFFDSNLKEFPQTGRPVEANQGMKAAGLGFVNSIGRGSGSCCQKGLMSALRFANLATVKRKVVVYVGDGGGTCGMDESTYLRQTLAMVTQQNYQRVQINAIGVLMQGRASQEQFLRNLVAANGGTYKRVN